MGQRLESLNGQGLSSDSLDGISRQLLGSLGNLPENDPVLREMLASMASAPPTLENPDGKCRTPQTCQPCQVPIVGSHSFASMSPSSSPLTLQPMSVAGAGRQVIANDLQQLLLSRQHGSPFSGAGVLDDVTMQMDEEGRVLCRPGPSTHGHESGPMGLARGHDVPEQSRRQPADRPGPC